MSEPSVDHIGAGDPQGGVTESLDLTSCSTRYWMLLLATLGQLATVLITWELWHYRADPPNLPVFELPQISFGIWILLTLMVVPFKPRLGFWLHVLVLSVASVFDQFRMQPQLLALVLLMWAAINDNGFWFCRWFLAAMWFWAGVHKLLSPHWFAHAGHWMLTEMGLSEATANDWHWHFAFAVGMSEVAVGLAAIFWLRAAAFLGAAMHLSIFVLLIFIRWNYSVLPWNLATAIFAAWVMWNSASSNPLSRQKFKRVNRVIEYAVAALLFIAPMGFFWGLLDHGYANVLYSDFVPRALITSPDGLREISGWNPVNVPFPYERRTHRQFFESIANNGDKLHIHDPRSAMDDLYFVQVNDAAKPIGRAEFLRADVESVAGVAMDDRHAHFWLRRCGVVTKRRYQESNLGGANLVSYAYTMKPECYSVEKLEMLTGLPNLEQLNLAGCPVKDDDLAVLAKLTNLQGIGLSNTAVTDEGLRHLEGMPKLRMLEVDNTQISPNGLNRLKESLGL